MKVKAYDQEVDVLTIQLSNAPVEESDQDKPGVILDYDKDGNILGLEILNASKRNRKSSGIGICGGLVHLLCDEPSCRAIAGRLSLRSPSKASNGQISPMLESASVVQGSPARLARHPSIGLVRANCGHLCGRAHSF